MSIIQVKCILLVRVWFLLESIIRSLFCLFSNEEFSIIVAFQLRLLRNVIFIQATIFCLLILCQSFDHCSALPVSHFS